MLEYRDTDAAVRAPHVAVEVANIDLQIKYLAAKREALTALHTAAKQLILLGYTRRQVRCLAGHDLI